MKQEVRRGRKFVEYHDPDTQPEGTFVQEIGAHDVSYQDEQGTWLPADENWQTDGADGYIIKADKLNHKVRLKGNGGRAWYPRRNVASEYLTFGVPQYWTGSKWSNFGFTGWSVDGKTITLNTRQNITILVHSRWNGIKIDWVLASSSAPSRMRYPVALTGITYVDGIIYGADGTRLGQLMPTTATDANGLELACTGAYSGGYVEFQADVTGAVYPVTIDPDFAGDTGDVFITSASNQTTWDGARQTSGSTTNNASLLIGAYTGYITQTLYYNRRAFLKFDTSSIIDTDTITQVNLKLTPSSISIPTNLTNYDILIMKQNWAALDLTNATDRETAYDGCLGGTQDNSIWGNTANLSANTSYTSGNLDTSYIVKDGYTTYSLLVSYDLDNIAPVRGPGTTTQQHGITLASASGATESYRPVLIVAYEAGGDPSSIINHIMHYRRLMSR